MYKPVDLHKKKADALVIHCADPRFQNAYHKVIDGLGQYYDRIVMPGASKAVADNDTVVDSIKLLHSFHNFETVHILDHIECGAFGKIDDEIKAHSSALQQAAKKIREALPQLKVVPHLLGQDQELPLELQG